MLPALRGISHVPLNVTTYIKTEHKFRSYVTPMNSFGCGNSIFVIARVDLWNGLLVMFRCCSPNLKTGETRFLAFRPRERSTDFNGGQCEKTTC